MKVFMIEVSDNDTPIIRADADRYVMVSEQIREILESGSSGDGEGDGSARLIVKK